MTEHELNQAIEEINKSMKESNKIGVADRILWFIVGGLVVWFLSHLGIL